MFKKLCATMLVALVGSAVVACGSVDDSGQTAVEGDTAGVSAEALVENEAELNLVARYDVPGVSVLRFYQPTPDGVLIIETGVAEKGGLLSNEEIRGKSAVEIYEHVSGQKAPAALVKAAATAKAQLQARASAAPDANLAARAGKDELVRESSPLLRAEHASNDKVTTNPGDAAKEQLGSVSQSLSYSEWKEEKCHEDNGAHELSAIFFKVYDTLERTWNDRDQISGATFCIKGSVRMRYRVRPWWNWSDFASLTLNAGQSGSFYYTDGPDFDANIIVDRASDEGDLYSSCNYGWTN